MTKRASARSVSMLLLAAAVACCGGCPALAQLAGAGIATAPHVATNAALAASRTAAYRNGLWRDHYAPGGNADGPLFFTPQTGTCAAHKWVNDGGNCVDGPDGNSWKAVHQHNILDVKEFGALGNNATDDTAAIQAAINAARTGDNIAQAYLVVPSGNYCFKTPGGVSINGAPITVVFQGNAVWKSCGNVDTTILTMNGNHAALLGQGGVQGWNNPSTKRPALVVGSSCIECVIGDRIVVQYGTIPIKTSGVDMRIWAKAANGYGSAIAQAAGGAFWLRNKFDQPYPTNSPPAAPYTLSAWAAGTRYSKNALVSIVSNSWILQEIANGSCTSGRGREPAAAPYGTAISDGTCTWMLAQPYTYYALEIQSGPGPSFVDKLDATGTFTCSVAVDNANDGGNGPQLVTLRDGNFGEPLHCGVLAANGQGLFIEGGSATNCVLANCKGIDIRSTWSDKVHIGDGFIAYQNPYGVYVGGGVGFVMNGASVHGSRSACVDIAAGVSKFVINSNDFSTGPTWGTCRVGVKVEPGASDYYSISNNIVQGSTIGISDAGTGKHKTVMGNN